MTTNPYSPPRSSLLSIADTVHAPALWNPDAAARWSLLFSPIFGAWLHMKNWAAMGEDAKAQVSKLWVIGMALFFIGIIVASLFVSNQRLFDAISRLGGLVLLVTWYFVESRPQQAHVKALFGTRYPRKGWGLPMLLAVAAFVGMVVLVFVLAFTIVTLERSH